MGLQCVRESRSQVEGAAARARPAHNSIWMIAVREATVRMSRVSAPPTCRGLGAGRCTAEVRGRDVVWSEQSSTRCDHGLVLRDVP